MGGYNRIWSPVILSELAARPLQFYCTFQLDRVFHSIQDIRVGIQTMQAVFHNRNIAVNIQVDVVCLLQGIDGAELVHRDAQVEEWLPVGLFNSAVRLDKKTHFVVDVPELTWEGELKDGTIIIKINLSYTIMATCYQVVELTSEPDQYPESPVILGTIHRLEEDMRLLEWDREELHRKIVLYEKNIISLKNGIRKAENRNMTLNRELSQCLGLIEELRSQLVETKSKPASKDTKTLRKQEKQIVSPTIFDHSSEDNAAVQKDLLGSRVRHLFAN